MAVHNSDSRSYLRSAEARWNQRRTRGPIVYDRRSMTQLHGNCSWTEVRVHLPVGRASVAGLNTARSAIDWVRRPIHCPRTIITQAESWPTAPCVEVAEPWLHDGVETSNCLPARLVWDLHFIRAVGRS